MAGDVPDSFRRLGLLPDAAARDIRRAYARALKKIDQAADAAGFQELRGAYEAALAYAESQAPEAEPAMPAAPATRPPPADASMPHPEQLAEAVFNALCAGLAALAAQRDGDADADEPYQDALRQALADARLFNIEARQGFEWRVAVLLARGWRSGNDVLLTAAAAVFGWSHGARLAGLGHAGTILERALDEHAIFGKQALVDRQAQRRVLQLLRQNHRPEHGQMMQDLPFFARMQVRFPHWLAIMAPQDALAWWEAHRHDPEPVLAPMESSSWANKFLLQAVVLVVMVAATYLLNGPAPDRPAPPPPRVPGEPIGHRPPPPHDVPITQERFEDVTARVAYAPARSEKYIARAVTFQVLLDFNGEAFGVNLISGSGDPALDAAVKTAILASKPFPPDAQKNFRFTYIYTPPARGARQHA